MNSLMIFLAFIGLIAQHSAKETTDPIQKLLNQKDYLSCMDLIFNNNATPTLDHYYQVKTAIADKTSPGRYYHKNAKILYDFLQQYFQETGEIPVSTVIMREPNSLPTHPQEYDAVMHEKDRESYAPKLPVFSQHK